MTRPIYESRVDRDRQREAIAHLERMTASTAVETARLVAWDFEMVRDGRTVAIVEVKCRTNPMLKYPTYMVSATKAAAIRDEAASRRIAGVLLVRWSDAIGWVRLDRLVDWKVSSGGRTDRADPLDIEPVLHVEIPLFRASWVCESPRPEPGAG